jgi:hypothetical protein
MNQPLTIANIISAFNLDINQIKSIYLVGSRLYNTHHSNSDYDFTIIMKNTYKGQKTYKHKNLNAQVFTENEYITAIQAHTVNPVLYLYLPQEAKWLETNWHKHFNFNPNLMRKSLKARQKKDWKIAEKHVAKGNIGKARKIVTYIVRENQLINQLIQQNDIYDWINLHKFINQFQQLYDWPSIKTLGENLCQETSIPFTQS